MKAGSQNMQAVLRLVHIEPMLIRFEETPFNDEVKSRSEASYFDNQVEDEVQSIPGGNARFELSVPSEMWIAKDNAEYIEIYDDVDKRIVHGIIETQFMDGTKINIWFLPSSSILSQYLIVDLFTRSDACKIIPSSYSFRTS